MYIIRRFSAFAKAFSTPTDKEIAGFKSRLLKSSWNLTDDVLSTYPAKQMYVTLESLLDDYNTPFMETLNTSSKDYNAKNNVNTLFKIGDPIPAGYSLAYCNPLSNENELSIDGFDNYHSPTAGGKEFFKRRMWVSGSFSYDKSNPLRFGDSINFKETVERVKVLPKNNIIFADYKRSFDNSTGTSMVETRRLCYLNNHFQATEKRIDGAIETPDKSVVLKPSIITSFRMSALTFNSHQIHYNPYYAQDTESYTDVVLEAPLLIALVLQFWSKNNSNSQISSFNYKITSPCFINRPITLNYKTCDKSVRLWISNDTSGACLESTIKI